MLSLTIQINYEFDTSDFFNTQAKKDAMQTVANQVAATINDHLAAIVPSGTNIWTAAFVDPSSGAGREVNNLVVPADTLIVYVGGQALPSGVGAEAGPGTSAPYSTVPVTPGEDPAYEAWSATVTQRGKSQPPGPAAPVFAPWGGSISFNTAAQFDFGSGAQTPPGEISFNPVFNFAAVAWHELGHVLGIGLAPTWQRYVTPGGFVGPNAEAAYGGPVPLQPGGGHWAAGLVFDGTLDLMDGGGDSATVTSSGTVPLDPVFSRLDYAALEDIGWVVQPPAMAAVIPQATGIVSVTHSRKGITSITIGFNEALEPGSADNRGLYSVLEGVKKQEDGLQQGRHHQEHQLRRQQSHRGDQACQGLQGYGACDGRSRHRRRRRCLEQQRIFGGRQVEMTTSRRMALSMISISRRRECVLEEVRWTLGAIYG